MERRGFFAGILAAIGIGTVVKVKASDKQANLALWDSYRKTRGTLQSDWECVANLTGIPKGSIAWRNRLTGQVLRPYDPSFPLPADEPKG